MFFSTLSSELRPVLDAAVSGPVFFPGSPGYADEVAGRRFAPFSRPAAIVGAMCAEDVAFAVRIANLHGLPVSLFAPGSRGRRSGSGGIVLTTSRMTGVAIDTDAGTARVGAGARWADVVAVAERYGFTPLADPDATAGAARSSACRAVELATAGNLGAVSRALGFDSARVRGFEVVTAHGRFLHVDAIDSPELFAALLGGRAKDTIVTELAIELVDISGTRNEPELWSAEDADEVLRVWVEESAGMRPRRVAARVRELARR